MKTYSPTIAAYHDAGKAHWQINFVSFLVKAIDDPDVLTPIHFCSAEDDLIVEIADPDTGALSTSTFSGGGHIVGMGDLVRSEGAVIRSHTFALSSVSDLVVNMVQGFNCRGAPFLWFHGEVDQDTGMLIDRPTCELAGFVEIIRPVDEALKVGSSAPARSYFGVSVDSFAAAFTARNYDMRSLDVSKARGGDLFFQHADSAKHWVTRWGKEKKREKDKPGKGGHDGRNGTAVGVGGTGRVRPSR